MQIETHPIDFSQENARDQVIQLLRSTFNASTQGQQKDAENTVLTLLRQPSFFEKMYKILTETSDLPKKSDLHKAAAIMIKKFSYDYSKTDDDKSNFIEMLYNLITGDTLDFACKDLLSSALQSQFIQDKDNKYRKTVVQKVLNMLLVPECLKFSEGLIMIILAYMNSLEDYEDQIEFFQYSLGNLNQAAQTMLAQIKKMSIQELKIHQNIILPKINKMFDYIEVAIERIMDDEQYFANDLRAVRQNSFFISILENYMDLFNNNGSIISTSLPEINQAKRVIVNIITTVYTNYKCSVKIFQSIYMTFLVQSQYLSRDCTNQSIIISCMEMLSAHLSKRCNYHTYHNNVPQTIIALFMYSVTSKQELETLNNSPEEFSDIAEYYSYGEDKYYNLKVKASVFLKTFIGVVDGAFKQLLEIISVIILGSLEPLNNDSDVVSEVKAESQTFNFNGLTRDQKLETSLMMLCCISGYAAKREQLQAIFALLITQFDAFMKINSPLVVLRLMRVISCYSIALYFPFIEEQMKNGRVYILEGLRCFVRILSTNKFAELFPFLTKTMIKVLNDVSVTDELMNLIVISNFHTMVKNSPELYQAVRKRIREEFYQNIQRDIHIIYSCFNLLSTLIKKQDEKTQEGKNQLFQTKQLFFEFSHFMQQPQNKQIYQKCDEKLAEVYYLIIVKSKQYIPEEVDMFVQNSIKYLPEYEKGTIFFKFFNSYIFKHTGVKYKIEPLFWAFWVQIKRRMEIFNKTKIFSEAICYFCFLISQILANYIKIDFSEQDLKFLLHMADIVPDQYKQYPLVIFLTYFYVLPYPVSVFLKQHELYNGFVNGIVNVQFNGFLIKRIFILAMIKLLEIEEKTSVTSSILLFCTKHLESLIKKPQIEKKNPSQTGDKRRPLNGQKQKSYQQAKQQKNDNELLNLFVNFEHPFSSMSEFDQFKFIFYQNNYPIHELPVELRQSIKNVLETQWVENKTRKILIVKK